MQYVAKPTMSTSPQANLLSILHIEVILELLTPHLTVQAIQNLCRSGKQIRRIIKDNPSVYRRLDLSLGIDVSGITFKTVLNSRILQYTRTLVLDGHDIGIDVLQNLLLSGGYQIRILSIIETTGYDEEELVSLVSLLARNAEIISEPRRLQGIYWFTPARQSSKQNDRLMLMEEDEKCQDWYGDMGRVLIDASNLMSSLVDVTQDRISWNASLCNGPRHHLEGDNPKHLLPEIASFSLGLQGCSICGSLPEGPASKHLPLLSPPPFTSFSIEAAKAPARKLKAPKFFARCSRCIEGRMCLVCRKFYCEACCPIVATSTHHQQSTHATACTLHSMRQGEGNS